jgi:TonB family protein
MKNCIYIALLLSSLTMALPAYAQDSTVIKKQLEFADVAPEYPGGFAAYTKFLQDNVNYPKKAIKAGTEGTVNLKLSIDSTGKLVRIEVLKGLQDSSCVNEAVKAVKLMPKWKPGMINGKPVNSKVLVPVKFSLLSKKKKKRD